MTSCDLEDMPDPMDDDPALGQVIIVRGINSGVSVNYTGNCSETFNESFRGLSLFIPPSWTLVGEGGAPDEPDFTELLFDIVPDELRVGVEMIYQTELENKLYPQSAFISGGATTIDVINFGDRMVNLYKDGDSYMAAFPVITYKDWNVPNETGDIYAVVRVGSFIQGDINILTEADALGILKSARTPECMGAYFAERFQNYTIEYVD